MRSNKKGCWYWLTFSFSTVLLGVVQGWCHSCWWWAFLFVCVTLPGETWTNVCSPQIGAKKWFYLSWWSSEFIGVTFMCEAKAADQEAHSGMGDGPQESHCWSSLAAQLLRGSLCLHNFGAWPQDLVLSILCLFPESSEYWTLLVNCFQKSPHKHTGVT